MIGKLRRIINFVTVTQGQPDGIGGYLSSETTSGDVYCQVSELTGRRLFEFQSLFNEQPIVFKMRSDSFAVTPNALITYDNIEYSIHSITQDELKRFTEIVAWPAN